MIKRYKIQPNFEFYRDLVPCSSAVHTNIEHPSRHPFSRGLLFLGCRGSLAHRIQSARTSEPRRTAARLPLHRAVSLFYHTRHGSAGVSPVVCTTHVCEPPVPAGRNNRERMSEMMRPTKGRCWWANVSDAYGIEGSPVPGCSTW